MQCISGATMDAFTWGGNSGCCCVNRTHRTWKVNTSEFAYFIKDEWKTLTYKGGDLEGFFEYAVEGNKYVFCQLNILKRVSNIAPIIDFVKSLPFSNTVKFKHIAIERDSEYWVNSNNLYCFLESRGINAKGITDKFNPYIAGMPAEIEWMHQINFGDFVRYDQIKKIGRLSVFTENSELIDVLSFTTAQVETLNFSLSCLKGAEMLNRILSSEFDFSESLKNSVKFVVLESLNFEVLYSNCKNLTFENMK